ncbi:MAG TPA: hypothetical protein VMV92_15480 [Streptosporangiaceae bacterium]|nr:hypothetical protein [Streptosporangiaceae bacterium]
MTVSTYRYAAYRMNQTSSSEPLILFSASALDISAWVGIPQRGRLDGGETVGFQRQENETRVRELAGFFKEPRNVVQNPLLCALQDENSVSFTASEVGPEFGHLEITAETLTELTLLELVNKVMAGLEARMPNLTTQSIDQARLAEVIRRASEIHDLTSEENSDADMDLSDDEGNEDNETDSDDDDTAGDVASVLLTEETQLVDFYQELRVRADVLSRLSPGSDPDELLGFTKESMISYLQPVVLVDGQHRLRGAVTSAKMAAESAEGREEVRRAIDDGVDADEAEASVIASNARDLPISLLLNSSPSEHVFQFIVVNQKATPMGKALLGTIVSTSLSRDEMEPIAQRLRNAGIRLEDSQAVAYLTRADESPFKGLVQTGVVGDQVGHLQWSVLKGLTSIFRELRGGRLYHQTVDYAAKWRRRELIDSGLVARGGDPAEKYSIWSEPDGPWRDVFIRFFALVRERFSDDDLEAHNAWGRTSSNLYNKISLTIIAADYFQFLDDRRRSLNSVEDVDETFSEWLEGVNNTYFARDWRMGNLKKDQGPVQKRWAATWFEYRKDPERLPRVENYRP